MSGISIEAVTERYFERYDRDRSGDIGLQGQVAGRLQGKRSEAAVHSQTVIDPRSGRVYGSWNQSAPERLQVGGARALAIRDAYVTSERFFRLADKDGDQRVTRIELANAIRLFDTDGDGRLQDAEKSTLATEFGETYGTTLYHLTPAFTVSAPYGDVDQLGAPLLN